METIQAMPMTSSFCTTTMDHSDLLNDVWDSDLPVSELRSEFSEDIHSSADNLMSSMLDGLVRHDRLLTDSLNLGVAHLATSPMTGNGNMTTSENHQIISQISQLPVKTEHSYSMAGSDGDSIPDSPLSLHDTDDCYPYMSLSSVPSETSIKDEPLSPMNDSSNNLLSELFAPAANIGLIVKEEPASSNNESNEIIQKSATLPSLSSSSASIPMLATSQPPLSSSRLPSVSNTSTTSMHSISKPKASVPPLISHGNRLMYSKVKVDHEPRISVPKISTTETTRSPNLTSAVIRPTSTASMASVTSTTKVVFGLTNSSSRHPIQTSLISSQPKGATGVLHLTEEEKRTLISEGYPIPQRLPLTKSEEKSLKKIRRKIKNKISAQESRRKKKEYMDCLERRMQSLIEELEAYKHRFTNLEGQNISLRSQVQQLQAQVSQCNCTNK